MGNLDLESVARLPKTIADEYVNVGLFRRGFATLVGATGSILAFNLIPPPYGPIVAVIAGLVSLTGLYLCGEIFLGRTLFLGKGLKGLYEDVVKK